MRSRPQEDSRWTVQSHVLEIYAAPPNPSRAAAYHRPMARHSDPARIYGARRAAVESNLTGSGMPQGDAQLLLAAWEARAALSGMDRDDRDYWQAGADWIDTERRRR